MRIECFFASMVLLLIVSCSTKNTQTYSVPDPSDVAMYQVNPRLFAQNDCFRAFENHMDSVKALGVNVVWFMPICEIGRNDKSQSSPYCVKDYKDINPEYGTMDDFKSVIRACHSKGMSVIIDWVANHTSWDSRWITEHPDWYTHDEDGEIVFPEGTNWEDVADLDFDNQEMRLAMIDAMKFWVEEVGVDGFRCDAADFVPFDFWEQCVTSLRSIPGKNLLLLAEGNRKDHFDAGFDMNYAWEYIGALRQIFSSENLSTESVPVTVLFETDTEEYDSIPEECVKLRFTTNHDESSKQSPIREFAGERGSMAAFVATTYLHGGALIYGSQEIGYPGRINFFHHVPVDWTANGHLYKEYIDLMSLYNTYPAIRKGTATFFPDDDVLIFEKSDDTDSLLICINLRQEYKTVSIPSGWSGKVCKNMMTGEKTTLGSTAGLNPFEYIILK